MLKGQITVLDMPLQGMTQLGAVLEIVKNEKNYNKYLKKLEKQRDELIELIETVGKVESIDLLKKQVKDETKKLESELTAIDVKKEEAATFVAQTKMRVASMEADAASRIRDQKTVLDMREKELHENRKQLNDRDKELQKAEAKIHELQLSTQAELDRLHQLQETANKSRIDYQERREQIEKAIAGV